MKSSEYWKKREAEALKNYQKDEAAYYEEIQEIYADMMERIQKEIDSFYIKYAVKEDISMAEAKKRVSQLDIKAYARKAKKYVRNRDFSDEANEEMRLYNATMKINRLEMLKANIGLELVSGYDELQKYFEQTLTDRTLEEFRRQAGILGKTITDNTEMAHSIVNASFHNAKFSDRIWMHQDVLKNQLSSLLQTGLIQGRNPRQLAVELRKYFNVGINNSERLMRTELARVQTAAQKRSFEKNGFEEYEFIANGTACEKCAGLDGQHFKVAKMMPGTNAPPMHPNCRCSTAAYQDSAEYEAWLDFLDKGGSTEEWEFSKNRKTRYEDSKSSLQSLDERTKRWDAVESLIYEKGISNKRTPKKDEYKINRSAIEVNEYKRKFAGITGNSIVDESIYKYAKAGLIHRDGTNREDLYIISKSTGRVLGKNIASTEEFGVRMNDSVRSAVKNNQGDLIGLHTHPDGTPPTGSDFETAFKRGYYLGTVACSDGSVYTYGCANQFASARIIDDTIEKFKKIIDDSGKKVYSSDREAHLAAIKSLGKDYGIWYETR